MVGYDEDNYDTGVSDTIDKVLKLIDKLEIEHWERLPFITELRKKLKEMKCYEV